MFLLLWQWVYRTVVTSSVSCGYQMQSLCTLQRENHSTLSRDTCIQNNSLFKIQTNVYLHHTKPAQNTKYTYLSTYIIRMEWLQHGLCEQSSQRSDTQYKVDEQLGGLWGFQNPPTLEDVQQLNSNAQLQFQPNWVSPGAFSVHTVHMQ